MFLGASNMPPPRPTQWQICPPPPQGHSLQVSSKRTRDSLCFWKSVFCADGSLTSTTAHGILQCPHPQREHRGVVFCWPPVHVTGTPKGLAPHWTHQGFWKPICLSLFYARWPRSSCSPWLLLPMAKSQPETPSSNAGLPQMVWENHPQPKESRVWKSYLPLHPKATMDLSDNQPLSEGAAGGRRALQGSELLPRARRTQQTAFR